jgi:ADP-ribose pyrophosphatase YjhB (NUDIX family)
MIPEEKTLFEATVCFLMKGGRVLLARKKKKIGAGCWNGYGGGLEHGESVVAAAIRELFEESGVTAEPASLEKVAVIDFHNTKSDGSVFVCRVHFFFVRGWTGVPKKTKEMSKPAWFEVWNVPLLEMMPADKIFFPFLLAGKKLVGTVHYGPFQKTLMEDPVFAEVTGFSAE